MLEGRAHISPPDMFHAAPGPSHVERALRLEQRLWCFPQTESVNAALTVGSETRTSLTGTEMSNHSSQRDYS